MDFELIGTKFYETGCVGDFYWMCDQKEYEGSLFIFNDNEEYHNSNRKGAGNAIMRKYNKYSHLEIPLSAGIPTGTLEYGGYTQLDSRTKAQIDSAINEIIELVNVYGYKRVYYSSEPDGMLGTSIFEVDIKVRKYITSRLFGLTQHPVQIVKILPNDYFQQNDLNDK